MSMMQATLLKSGVPRLDFPYDKLSRCLSAGTRICFDEPLARHTTLRVGGPADVYVEPAGDSELALVLEFCAQNRVHWFILGRGSNVLVKDGGFRGVVICLAAESFRRIEVASREMHCGAGARLKAVAVEAKRHGITGFEFLEGIPGSIGGALRMNAGAMGSATFDRVESVRVMDRCGQIEELPPAKMNVVYRSCGVLKDKIALSAILSGETGEPTQIAERMNQFSRKRWQSQPAAPSAGCMFKNPVTVPAGKLVDELGLKGTRIGGALISLEHGNFIVNEGNATAQNILDLIELIRNRARTDRGLELETEVEIIGD
jgi:UDP-N-acetylenolpyruvoylglucosamine reductase